jgi:tetratricopeptide (TPR) repeat protein
MLEVALKNVREHFTVLGFTERFDETLLLLERRLGWHRPYYVKANVTKERKRKDEIGAEDRAAVERYNRLDAELYRQAEIRFEAEIRALGPGFPADLEEFRSRNRRLEELTRSARAARQSGAWLEAIGDLLEAVDLDPRCASAHAGLATVYRELGEVDRALTHAAEALAVDPYDREVVLVCGDLLRRCGRHERARRLYDFYVREQSPYDRDVNLARAELLGDEPASLHELLAACARLG